MKNDLVKPFVTGLLVLQAALTALLWLLDAISVASTAAFALLMAAELLAFATISHVYMTAESDDAEAASTSSAP